MPPSRHLTSRLVLLGCVVAAALVASLIQGLVVDQKALLAALRSEHALEVDERFGLQPVGTVSGSDPAAWSNREMVFLARSPTGGPRDLWVADVLIDTSGRPRRLNSITNLTMTADADEGDLVVSGGGRVALSTRLGERVIGVRIFDFAGEPAGLTAGWETWARWAARINNWQRTGRLAGLDDTAILFTAPVASVAIGFEGESLIISGASGATRLVVSAAGRVSGGDAVVQRLEKGRPAPLAWAVDTVRAIPWIGSQKIEALERIWFEFDDWRVRLQHRIAGTDETHLAALPPTTSRAAQVTGLPDWPPPALAPKLKPVAEGEGVWAAVADGFFTVDAPGPPLFYYTFLRIDPERRFAPVHFTTWDPARVSLGMVAGVQEPQSTTGIRGTGEVPREAVPRLVAAFNGAFQALHGEWGMALDRRTFLPPRAYGSTVAVLTDGRVGFGTWPHPVAEELPPTIRDLRQNLNPIIDRGVFNPFRRTYWGGVAPNATDQVFTQRSALCLTKGGKLLFAWAEHQSPEALGEALVRAGCDHGMHLDMNAGHCGFEYYRIDEQGHQPVFGRKLEANSEAEGEVPRRPDLVFRARRMVERMGNMRFPRYIGRDPRDFFYLLRKPSLFDDPVVDDGKPRDWQPVAPVAGMPPAAVSVRLRGGVQLLKVDLGQVAISVEGDRPDGALLALPYVARTSGAPARMAEVVPPLFDEAAPPVMDQGVGRPAAMLGLDDQGYLVLASDGSVPALEQALAGVHIEPAVALIGPTGQLVDRVWWLVIRAKPVPAWVRLFPEVQPVPPSIWKSINKRRGNLLDHSAEGASATAPSVMPTNPPSPRLDD